MRVTHQAFLFLLTVSVGAPACALLIGFDDRPALVEVADAVGSSDQAVVDASSGADVVPGSFCQDGGARTWCFDFDTPATTPAGPPYTSEDAGYSEMADDGPSPPRAAVVTIPALAAGAGAGARITVPLGASAASFRLDYDVKVEPSDGGTGSIMSFGRAPDATTFIPHYLAGLNVDSHSGTVVFEERYPTDGGDKFTRSTITTIPLGQWQHVKMWVTFDSASAGTLQLLAIGPSGGTLTTYASGVPLRQGFAPNPQLSLGVHFAPGPGEAQTYHFDNVVVVLP